MRCPQCGEDDLSVDFTPNFNSAIPYELVCYECGYFSVDRYSTREEAEKVLAQ